MLQKSADENGAGAVSVTKAPGSIKIAAPGENVDLPPAPLRTFETIDIKDDEKIPAGTSGPTSTSGKTGTSGPLGTSGKTGTSGEQPKFQASKLKMALGGTAPSPQLNLGPTAVPEFQKGGISKNLPSKVSLDETGFAPQGPLQMSEGTAVYAHA